MTQNTDGTGHNLALIDDDEAARLSIGQMLRLRNYNVEIFSSADAALAWPGLKDTETVITDIRMPGTDGEEFLVEVQNRQMNLPVIIITGHGDVSLAVRCLKKGAYDFVEKPFEDEVLLASVARAVEKSVLERERSELRRKLDVYVREDGSFGLIGRSRVMQDLYEQIEIVCQSEDPVLIMGETGVGKELVARAIHAQSARSARPFIAVNVGGLSESFLESELFGHVRGAFTGAMNHREGKLVSAHQGTLLLDEIESIPMPAQVKLLRVLEDGLVYPLGRDEPVHVNVRIIATSKVNLKEQVEKRLMREDFYYRIMVLPVHVPPLRERTEDILLLLSHYMKTTAERSGMPVPRLPDSELDRLMDYAWPGNVRELKHSVERMMMTARNGVAGSFSFDDRFETSRLLSLPGSPGKLHDALEKTEWEMIRGCLEENRGEINPTARDLGISRRALYERMKKYSLNRNDFKVK